jgi:hypothetical protein
VGDIFDPKKGLKNHSKKTIPYITTVLGTVLLIYRTVPHLGTVFHGSK